MAAGCQAQLCCIYYEHKKIVHLHELLKLKLHEILFNTKEPQTKKQKQDKEPEEWFKPKFNEYNSKEPRKYDSYLKRESKIVIKKWDDEQKQLKAATKEKQQKQQQTEVGVSASSNSQQ